jgi:hypothetical protein
MLLVASEDTREEVHEPAGLALCEILRKKRFGATGNTGRDEAQP